MYAQDSDSTMSPPDEGQQRSGIFHEYRRTRLMPRIVTALITFVLFAIAFIHYESDVDTTAFHPDESRWINRAHYLEDVLDPFGPTWNDQYLTRGQPPIGSYVMGIGFLVQGEGLDTNPAWDYRRGWDWNTQNGMYPTQEDLRTGRMTNVFLGSVAVAVTFLAVRMLSNTIGGIAAAIILIAHPLQAWHNRLALADTTLTLTLAAVVLTLILLMRKPGWFKALAVGALLGIGGANKLTPMALSFVIAAVGVVLLAQTIYQRNKDRKPGTSWLSTVPGVRHLSWMLISAPVIAGATFVAVYPYLWPHPVDRTLTLLDFRQNEMEAQSRLYPQFAVESPWEALERTWVSLSGGTNESGQQMWSATDWLLTWIGLGGLGDQIGWLDLVVAFIGTILLFVAAVRLPISSGHLIAALVLVAQVLTIVLAMQTDFERYYLPIVLATAILAGCGVGLASRALPNPIANRFRQDRRHSESAPSLRQHGAEVTGS